MIAAGEGLGHHFVLAAHVTVGCRLGVDGFAEFEVAHDLIGSEVEHLFNLLSDFSVAHLHV